MDERVRDLMDEFGVLKAQRLNWETTWSDIQQNVIPHRTGFEESPEKGQRHDSKIYDGTPLAALNTYASGSQGYLLSNVFKWFGLRVAEERVMDIREVRMWLSVVEQVLYGLVQRSNFYKQVYELFRDGGAFGTATLYTWFDEGERKEWFTTIHPREIYIAENDNGEVDTVFHHYQMSYKRAMQRFKNDTVHPEVEKAAGEAHRKYEEMEILRVVRPNERWERGRADNASMRFESLYIDVDHQVVMREGGHAINPYAVWRVEKSSDEAYGRGPGWTALADIKALYAYAKSDITAAQLMVNPPLEIPTERYDFKYLPGGRNYYDDQSRRAFVMDTRIDLKAGLEREERTRKIIEKHFLVDFFLLMSQMDRDVTATEIRRRQEEKAVILGPHIAGLNQDVLDRIIDRLFMDAWDAGMIPPPPRVLVESGQHMDVDYMGPLAQAQRSFFHSEPYRASLGDIMGVAQLRPDVLDNYNWDFITREMSKAQGMPEEALLDEKIVAQVRQVRQQQLQQQRQLAAMEQMGKAAGGLGKSVEEGSVLEAMDKEKAGAPG